MPGEENRIISSSFRRDRERVKGVDKEQIEFGFPNKQKAYYPLPSVSS